MIDIKISAVVITRNEERNLQGFLDSVSKVASEIIVVDDGSTDGTIAIAKNAGEHVRLIQHSMTDDNGFAGQRNAGIEQATGNWILNMDCDERLSMALVEEILSVLPKSKLNAYRYQRLNYFLHRPMRHGGWASWNRPQIARRGFHRFEGRLHETCVIDGGDVCIGQMQEVMHHLNDFDLEKRFNKSAQYTLMEADRIIQAHQQVTSWDLCWRPAREFLKKYLIQKGFLEGVPGFIAAAHSGTATFRAFALAWDRQNYIERELLERQVLEKN